MLTSCGHLGGMDLTDSEPTKSSPKRSSKNVKIPAEVIQQARGIAIYSTFRAGMGLAGSAGSGIVMARLPDGTWSPPSAFSAFSVGAGVVWGADLCETVCVLNTDEAVREFTQQSFGFNADVGVTAGPVGTSAVALAAGSAKRPVWVYARSKGFFLNAQVDGTGFNTRDDMNVEFYGAGVTVDKILRGEVRPEQQNVARKIMGGSN